MNIYLVGAMAACGHALLPLLLHRGMGILPRSVVAVAASVVAGCHASACRSMRCRLGGMATLVVAMNKHGGHDPPWHFRYGAFTGEGGAIMA